MMTTAINNTHLLAVKREDLEHGVVPHLSPPFSAVKNLVLRRKEVIRWILPAHLTNTETHIRQRRMDHSAIAAAETMAVSRQISATLCYPYSHGRFILEKARKPPAGIDEVGVQSAAR